MKKKKLMIMSTLLVAIVLLGIGTIAYFRRTVNGNITGNAGNLVLIVNEANAIQNETFSVSLNRSEEEPYVLPDDKGMFNLNIDSNGSSTDVLLTITLTRTNLPDNLKFYLDSGYTQELTSYGTIIKKTNDMTVTVPLYWFWDGSVDDENDSLFINQALSANISVSATIAKTLHNTLLSMESTLDADVDFTYEPSETNGQGLMMRNGTQNDIYPIYYYRGDVSDNNVIYGDYCWLIVRTTETGGVKLIYNGEVNDDGSCNNYSGVGGVTANSDYLGTYINRTESAFNEKFDSPVYVGYMYNDVAFDILTIDDVASFKTKYTAHLSDNSIDSETGRHTQNLKDSTIKGVIDDWYESNIDGKTEESLLEDTVWCNDRSGTISVSGFFEYGFNNKIVEYFDNFENTILNLACNRDMDKFTVSSDNGNGDLTYPIGLLTAEEVFIIGSEASFLSILVDNSMYGCWTITPSFYSFKQYAIVEDFFDVGTQFSVSGYLGVRPSISLNNSTYLISGNGTFEKPYIVS